MGTTGVSAKKSVEQNLTEQKLLEDPWTLAGGDHRCKCKKGQWNKYAEQK